MSQPSEFLGAGPVLIADLQRIGDLPNRVEQDLGQSR